jgi:hypothetical protein
MKYHSFCASFAIVATCLASSPIRAAEPGKAPPALSMATALKLGAEGLVPKYAEDNEEGRDTAAGMYAQARQLETEYALAQKDLDLVQVLNTWRGTVSMIRQDEISLTETLAGGGTVYLHAAARDCAEVEDFMAQLAKRLPLAEGKGDTKASAAIKARIAEIKKSKLEADADKDAKEALQGTIEGQVANLEEFLTMLEAIPAEDAKLISAFALKTPKWMK